jgi:excisionase family DNA binding protein
MTRKAVAYDKRLRRQVSNTPEELVEPILLKPEEVAECLNIGRSKVYKLMRAGALESVRIGSRRRVPRTAVEEYIERIRKGLVAR